MNKVEQNCENIFLEDPDSLSELIDQYIMVWNARARSYCHSISSISRQFNEMLRHELYSEVIQGQDDVEYKHQVNVLHSRIQQALDADIDSVFGLPDRKSFRLTLEDYKVLIKMRERELQRIDRIESREWAQSRLLRRSHSKI